MSFKEFLINIFIDNSGVSSRRIGGFISLIALLFLVFFQYPIIYCKIIALLTIGFFGLTTITGLFSKQFSVSQTKNGVNTNIKDNENKG
jgi:hypothetical protein